MVAGLFLSERIILFEKATEYKSTTNENPGACLVTYSLTNLQVLLFSVIIQVTFVPPIFNEIFHFIGYNFNPSYGLT